ncbi:MAG: hypothetical protein CMJ39_06275 [Phycisphaerae bacterium]|nr:hypothetical protein [Phycisphaerae bacterium]
MLPKMIPGATVRGWSAFSRRSTLMAAVVVNMLMFQSTALVFSQTPPGDCPGFPDVVEGEPCGDQNNLGCQTNPPAFTNINCGDLVCSATWANNGGRDIDWYRLDVEDLDGSGTDGIIFQIRSSVPLLAEVFQDCFDPPVHIQDCEFDPATAEWQMDIKVCAPNLTEVLLRLGPGFMGSGPINDGFPCVGGGLPYYINVLCEPECDESLCPECIRAPEGLLAWWMMDESPGTTAAVDVVNNNNASHRAGLTVGVPGIVNKAVQCDGTESHLAVLDDPVLDFRADQDFGLMGWIRIDGGSGNRIIFGKPDAYVLNRGWALGIDDSNDLVLLMRDEFATDVSVVSNFPIPAQRWVHVAAMVDRDSSSGVKLYINGNLAGTGDPTPAMGSLANDEPLFLGAWDEGAGIANVFDGGLDELMMIDHVLPSDVIQRIAAAGCGGICKQRLHVTRFTPFCDGDAQTTAAITIFNDRPETIAFDLEFDGVPANGNDCQIDGPVVFDADTPNPIVIDGMGRREVIVTIDRPQSMNVDGETGCWRAKLADAARVELLQVRRGFVVQSDAICVEPLGVPIGVQPIPIGQVTPFEFLVHNRSSSLYSLMWKIGAVDAVTGQPNELLRLNQEEPGDPVLGLIDIPANDSSLVTVDAAWTFQRADESTKGKLTDIVMYEDPGKIDPDQGLGSKGGESTYETQASECPQGDVDCDGDVDVDDLLALLAAYGNCAGGCDEDLDGDGDVDVDDLLLLLAAYNS